MPTQKHVYTREDLKRLPDEWWVELVDGDLVLTPSPVLWHQVLANRLNAALTRHLRSEPDRVVMAPLDVDVDNQNVYQPDVMVFHEGFCAHPESETPTPVFVGEVISPKTAGHDLRKLPFYAAKGVREAWLIYPQDERVVVHDFVAGTVTEHPRPASVASAAIPGFVLDLRELFRVG